MTENVTKKRYKGKCCCAVNCSNSEGEDGLGFFKVIRKDRIQSEKWVQAIKRINQDGTPWVATKNHRLCSEHFASGEPSNEINHPDYVPSRWPPRYQKKKKTKKDIERYKRVSLIKICDTSRIRNAKATAFLIQSKL